MADRIFDVEYTLTRTVRVRVPNDPQIVYRGENPEDVAEEFALGGKSAWPEYVLSSDEDYDVESVREIRPKQEAAQSAEPNYVVDTTRHPI